MTLSPRRGVSVSPHQCRLAVTTIGCGLLCLPTGRTSTLPIYLLGAARMPVSGAVLRCLTTGACSLVACNLGLCCVHSFGSRADRSPPEGASCATMSSHTCYRTSRSFHFPFWAVCSLSGTQPEFSLGRLHPHVEKDTLSLFLASSQFNVLRASTRVRRPPGPTWPGSTRAEAAQHGSEDGSGSTCALRFLFDRPVLSKSPQLSQRAFLRLTVRGSSDMYPVHRSVPQRA